MTTQHALDELRFCAEADVYKAGVRAAVLRRTETGAVGYRYCTDYSSAPWP